MTEKNDARVIRVVVLGDQGVGKLDLYQWLLRRSQNVNEEVAVPVDPTRGSAPQFKSADHAPVISPHASAHITSYGMKRVHSALNNYPSLRPKQLLWLPSSGYESYTYDGGLEVLPSSAAKDASMQLKARFLRFSGEWKIGQEKMDVQVTFLQPVIGNTRALEECLKSGTTIILLVYNINDRASFQGLQEWVDNLNETKGKARRMMFLVGNRLDQERMTQLADAQAFAKENRLYYVETCASWDHQMEAMFSFILFKMKEKSEPLQTKDSDVLLISPKEDSFDEFRFQRERRSGGCEHYKLEDSNGKLITWRQVIDLWRNCPEFCKVFSYTLGRSEHAAFSLETTPVTIKTLDKAFQMVLINAPNLINAKPNKVAFQRQLKGNHPVACFANRGGDAILVAPTRWANDSYYVHLASFVRNAPEYQQVMLWNALGTAIEVRLEELGKNPLWVSTSASGVRWIHMRLDSKPKYYKHTPFTKKEQKKGFFHGIFRGSDISLATCSP